MVATAEMNRAEPRHSSPPQTADCKKSHLIFKMLQHATIVAKNDGFASCTSMKMLLSTSYPCTDLRRVRHLALVQT